MTVEEERKRSSDGFWAWMEKYVFADCYARKKEINDWITTEGHTRPYPHKAIIMDGVVYRIHNHYAGRMKKK